MKDEDLKKQSAPPVSTNPFLSKPLKKIGNINKTPSKPPETPKDNNKINEHRASKFINIQSNLKIAKTINTDKKPYEPPKNIHNNSPKDKTKNNLGIVFQGENKLNKRSDENGFKTILKKFNSQEKNKTTAEKIEENKKHKKRSSIEKFINPKIEENFKKENEIITQKNYTTNNSDQGDENKNDEKIQKIYVTVKESLSKKGEINKKEKEKENNTKENITKNKNNENNNIKDINEDNNKKENINNNISNVNNINNINNVDKKKEDLMYFKNDDEILKYIKNKIKEGKIQNIYQKLELKNNDFTGFSICKKNNGYITHEIKIEEDIKKINESIKTQKIEIKNKPIQFIYTDEYESLIKVKKEYDCLKEVTFTNIKNDYEKSAGTGNAKPKDKMVNKPLDNKNIKTNNISVEGIFKQKKENEIKEKTPPIKKVDDENKFAGIGAIPNISDKKAKEIQNQKRVSKAYNRFKKAFSLHKDKENEKNPGNSDKIHSLASMLQDHIIKPLSEIQEENEGGGKIYRGGSVECRKSKIVENNIVQLFENAPVTKKNVKKPKLNNFDNN